MKLSIIPSPTVIAYLQGYTNSTAPIEKINDAHFGKESFSIHIENTITIKTSDETGFFYAQQVLEQMKFQCGQNLPNVHIEDSPKYEYRSFMIDCARHFLSVENIKRMIENCEKLRFNVFHWHLTDDQGWRFESKKYPELTKIGSVRHGNHFGSEQNENIYGGYYTTEQMKDIVKFAHEHHMIVVPEVELPGHCSALLKAIPSLACNKKQVEIKTSAGIFDDLVCAGNEDTYKILEDILGEVCEIFTDEYVHIGGDEAPKKQWENCPDCKFRMFKERLADEEMLQGYFINRLSLFLESKGKKTISWNESLRCGNLSENIIVQQWMDRKDLCKNSPNMLIASDFFHCYADYPYDMTPLKKVYSYEPHINDNVTGLDTPIWTEYIDNIMYMEYMCFPRFIATAQVAWSKEKPSYDEFRNALTELVPFFDIKGMAPSEDWDPASSKRAKGIISHFGSISRNDRIRDLFNKEES